MTRVLLYAALLLGLSSFAVVEIWAPDKLLDWFIQITATFIGASLAIVGGVWLFRYQDRKTDEKLEEGLAKRVAVESKKNLELLEGEPATFNGTQVRVVPLSTQALSDLLRSNLLDPANAMHAMDREAGINAHNRQVEALWHMWSTHPAALYSPAGRWIISDVANRQKLLKEDCKNSIQILRDQGSEAPD